MQLLTPLPSTVSLPGQDALKRLLKARTVTLHGQWTLRDRDRKNTNGRHNPIISNLSPKGPSSPSAKPTPAFSTRISKYTVPLQFTSFCLRPMSWSQVYARGLTKTHQAVALTQHGGDQGQTPG